MSIYDKFMERIVALHAEGKSKAEIARVIKQENNLEQSEDSIRKSISLKLATLPEFSSPDASAIEAFAAKHGIDVDSISSYWLKDGTGISVNVKNKKGDGVNWEQVREEMLLTMSDRKPIFEPITYDDERDGHCLVLDPADIHIGKLCDSFETGEDYDNQIAVQRVKEGVRGILKSANGFDIEQIVFVGGNDVLHIDGPARKTTSGTPQDTDGMWFRNFKIAKELYIDLIGSLLAIAPVHFVFNPSNHDYTHGFFLADMIETYFSNHDGFTSDANLKHRKYYKYGQNLIGTTHGDGAKNTDLPLLMATEAPVDWSLTSHRYIYTHHVHHKASKDFQGVTVESLRSPSGTDSWHHRNGYQHAPKAVEGFIHHPLHGQVARLTYNF
jgi:hypothetical protein